MYGLCARNTYFARKANFAYVYDLCALSSLCVWIRLLRVSDLLRMYTNFALEAAYAYKYGIARKAAYFVSVRLFLQSYFCAWGTALRVKLLIIQGVYCSFRRGYDSRAVSSFKVTMNVDGVLYCVLTVLISCPKGYVRRMRSSVFSLRQSWLPIGPSFSKDSFFRLFSATILTSDWAVFLVWSWGFLRASYFNFDPPLDGFYLLNPVQ